MISKEASMGYLTYPLKHSQSLPFSICYLPLFKLSPLPSTCSSCPVLIREGHGREVEVGHNGLVTLSSKTSHSSISPTTISKLLQSLLSAPSHRLPRPLPPGLCVCRGVKGVSRGRAAGSKSLIVSRLPFRACVRV